MFNVSWFDIRKEILWWKMYIWIPNFRESSEGIFNNICDWFVFEFFTIIFIYDIFIKNFFKIVVEKFLWYDLSQIICLSGALPPRKIKNLQKERVWASEYIRHETLKISPCRSGGMVDAHAWGACGEICGGSSPPYDTIKKIWTFVPNFLSSIRVLSPEFF